MPRQGRAWETLGAGVWESRFGSCGWGGGRRGEPAETGPRIHARCLGLGEAAGAAGAFEVRSSQSVPTLSTEHLSVGVSEPNYSVSYFKLTKIHLINPWPPCSEHAGEGQEWKQRAGERSLSGDGSLALNCYYSLRLIFPNN